MHLPRKRKSRRDDPVEGEWRPHFYKSGGAALLETDNLTDDPAAAFSIMDALCVPGIKDSLPQTTGEREQQVYSDAIRVTELFFPLCLDFSLAVADVLPFSILCRVWWVSGHSLITTGRIK